MPACRSRFHSLLRGRVSRRSQVFLSRGIWIVPKSDVSAVIEEVPRYEQLAPIFKEMHDNGASIQSIASAHGLCWDQANTILHFAETGERPKWPTKQKRSPTDRNFTREKYESLCPEVVKRRASGESFAKIAVELRVCESTVRRAWDHAHQDQLKGAAMSGTTPDRGRYRHISDTTICEVQSLLKEGKLTIREIARTTGLSQSTVRRHKHRMTDK